MAFHHTWPSRLPNPYFIHLTLTLNHPTFSNYSELSQRPQLYILPTHLLSQRTLFHVLLRRLKKSNLKCSEFPSRCFKITLFTFSLISQEEMPPLLAKPNPDPISSPLDFAKTQLNQFFSLIIQPHFSTDSILVTIIFRSLLS